MQINNQIKYSTLGTTSPIYLGGLDVKPIDISKFYLLKEMCESDGIHKVLGALINIYIEKAKNDNEFEDYGYIRDQLAIVGSNIYNNTNEPYEDILDIH